MRVSLVCMGMLLSLVPALARAQSSSSTNPATYPAGWNMVSGPAGTSFAAAGTLYVWSGSTYVATTTVTSSCAGYWAYFQNPTAVNLPATAVTTQSCPLTAGWNLVGDPFSNPALLPPGTFGYWWDPGSGTYVLTSSIQPGRAVWIYLSAPAALTLTDATVPQTTPVPSPTLTVTYPTGLTGPYQVHVGDTVRVLVPSAYSANPVADATHFQAVDSGYLYQLSCTGAVCQTNPSASFWTWRAIAPGLGTIIITPACTPATSCSTAPLTVQVTILP